MLSFLEVLGRQARASPQARHGTCKERRVGRGLGSEFLHRELCCELAPPGQSGLARQTGGGRLKPGAV